MNVALTHALPASIALPAIDPTRALRFVGVGSAGTMLYAALFVMASTVLPTVGATVAAFVVSTICTNLVHRRVTFGVARTAGAWSDSAVAFGTAVLGLGLSTALTQSVSTLGMGWEVPMLVTGSMAGGGVRFVLMSWWLGSAR